MASPSKFLDKAYQLPVFSKNTPLEYVKKGIDKRQGTEYNLAVLLTGVRCSRRTKYQGCGLFCPCYDFNRIFLWNMKWRGSSVG